MKIMTYIEQLGANAKAAEKSIATASTTDKIFLNTLFIFIYLFLLFFSESALLSSPA